MDGVCEAHPADGCGHYSGNDPQGGPPQIINVISPPPRLHRPRLRRHGYRCGGHDAGVRIERADHSHLPADDDFRQGYR